MVERLIFHTAQRTLTGNPYIESGASAVSGVVVEGSKRQHVGCDAVGVGGSGGLSRRLKTVANRTMG